jgi:hypothetical protein
LKYLENSPSHARYRNLPPQIFEEGFRKFARRSHGEEIDESEKINEADDRLGFEADRPNLYFTKKLVDLALDSLIADIERTPGLRDLLKQVFANISRNDTPMYFSAGRANLLTDWDSVFSKSIDRGTMAAMAKKVGSFKDHLRATMINELEMQDVRVQRIEEVLHSQVVIPDGWLRISEIPARQSTKDYEKLLGRRLTRTETLGVHAEAGPLNFLALFSYVLKYKGIEMSDYDINSHYYPKYGRRRILSFYDYDGAAKRLFSYLKSSN